MKSLSVAYCSSNRFESEVNTWTLSIRECGKVKDELTFNTAVKLSINLQPPMSPEICSHEDVRSKTHNAADQHCYCMLTVLFVHSATSGFFQRVFLSVRIILVWMKE